MKSLQKDIQELTTAMENRNRHYKRTEDYFITYMKHSFKKILECRQFEVSDNRNKTNIASFENWLTLTILNFQGTIEINMLEKKLELIVIPQHGSQGLTTTSNLSGGERSFSTVAFLYSLWQCMEFPFYFLDEFDVYMVTLLNEKQPIFFK